MLQLLLYLFSFFFSYRERSDTIRSIVSSLVGEGGDLVDENEPPQPLQMQAEDYSDVAWEPEAIDAGPGLFHIPFLATQITNLSIKSSEQIKRTMSLAR